MRVKRGQVWSVDFEPQTHKPEPGKRHRPALVIQTDVLNNVGHFTTIVIPGTSQLYRDQQGDAFPLRVALQKMGGLKKDTDLLIDQIRAISNHRLLGKKPLTTLSDLQMQRVSEALSLITAPGQSR